MHQLIESRRKRKKEEEKKIGVRYNGYFHNRPSVFNPNCFYLILHFFSFLYFIFFAYTSYNFKFFWLKDHERNDDLHTVLVQSFEVIKLYH